MKNKTPQRIAVFIGLKIFEILAVCAVIFLVVFAPYIYGNYLINREVCDTDAGFTCGYYIKCLDESFMTCYRETKVQYSSKAGIWGHGLTFSVGLIIIGIVALVLLLGILYWIGIIGIKIYETLEKWIKYNWKKAGEIVNKK